MSKIKSGSVVVNPTDLQQGAVIESIVDRGMHLHSDEPVTWTGTELSFTQPIDLLLPLEAGAYAVNRFPIGLSPIALGNNQCVVLRLARTAGTTTIVAGTYPALAAGEYAVVSVASLNSMNLDRKDHVILFRRYDTAASTQLLYLPLNKQVLNPGQTVMLGASGSGSGSGGTGDDLGTLLYRASFKDEFGEGPADAKSGVDVTAGNTDSATYSAAKGMYVLNYDASKTIAAATTTTTINISANASFIVKTGDMVVWSNQARKITAIISQSSFTVDAFDVAPTLASQVTISQAVHTKDIYNFAVDGNAISAAFGSSTFSDILVDYEDSTTSGDNIWDVNTAPVLAFSASHNGTSFTNNQTRVTNETDTQLNTVLNGSGTNLYLRFFANKSSGTGTVNLISYKAFMQKTTPVSSGGVINQAYCLANGSGTELNCTVGLLGGKTAVTLTWQYAVGVNTGGAYGSIDVYVNGQLIPRFIDSTLTADASYVEVNSNVIQLDKDYSGTSIPIEVLQRSQIVDSSTTNSTDISQLQEIAYKGFQNFVDQSALINPTSATGTPAAGTYHSIVTNRAPIVDLSQDLKARFGSSRIVVQSAYRIENELGVSSEPVYGATNDIFGQIRYVGVGWQNVNSNNGASVNTSSLNDYAEIVFYGTGLNITMVGLEAGRDIRYHLDGIDNNTNIITSSATQSAILQTRNYAPHQIVPVVSGLTAGIHTIRLRLAAAVSSAFTSFEILNETSTVSVRAGSSFINGKKATASAATTFSYNSGFETGSITTRGGRVLVYQKLNGSVVKSVTPVDATSQFISSATHANEELARTHMIREFGASRVAAADDFSLLNANSNRAFVLDDNTTALVTNNAGFTNEVLSIPNTNDYISITFVGTGLDLIRQDFSASIDNYTVLLNNSSIGTLTTTGTTAQFTQRIASGLPYGTHNIRFLRTAAAVGALGFVGFKVYQPKKPTLPTGCIELADYNIVADYSAAGITGTAVLDNTAIATGVITKHITREFQYRGANWAIANTNGSLYPLGGTSTGTTTNNNQPYEYTFWGTGFVIHNIDSSGATYDFSVTVDGVLNATGTARSNASNLGGGSYRSTGTTGNAPVRIDFQGLTLGKHTVIVQRTAGAGNFAVAALHYMTPIHTMRSNLPVEQGNAMMVGANGIADNRAITPIKDANLQLKNVSQAVGITSSPTTNSTAVTPVPDLSVVHFNKSGKIKVSYLMNLTGTAGNGHNTGIILDGQVVFTQQEAVNAAHQLPYMGFKYFNVGPGFHKVEIYWQSGGATTLTANTTERIVIVEEL